MRDIEEHIRHIHQVGARVAAEADDLHADAHLLYGTDGRSEVAIARHDNRNVQISRGLEHVDDQLDVQVGLDPAVAVLANVLADHLVAAARQKGVKLPLVIVFGIQARIRIGAHEVSAGRCCLEQRYVINVDARRLGGVEDVRHVHEDGDVLAH